MKQIVHLSLPWRPSELPGAQLRPAIRCGPYKAPWEYHPERQCAAYLYASENVYDRCALLARVGHEFCAKHERMFS